VENMIYMGVIAFALFIGVYMIDELFVTDEHKWVKYLIIVEKFLLGFVLIVIASIFVISQMFG